MAALVFFTQCKDTCTWTQKKKKMYFKAFVFTDLNAGVWLSIEVHKPVLRLDPGQKIKKTALRTCILHVCMCKHMYMCIHTCKKYK